MDQVVLGALTRLLRHRFRACMRGLLFYRSALWPIRKIMRGQAITATFLRRAHRRTAGASRSEMRPLPLLWEAITAVTLAVMKFPARLPTGHTHSIAIRPTGKGMRLPEPNFILK